MKALWPAEFGSDYEVPAKLDALVADGTLVELSWHNDIAPSYALNNGLDGEDYRLWADHPDAQMRETGPETTRFYVCGYEKSGEDYAKTIYEGDDLEEAIKALLAKRK